MWTGFCLLCCWPKAWKICLKKPTTSKRLGSSGLPLISAVTLIFWILFITLRCLGWPLISSITLADRRIKATSDAVFHTATLWEHSVCIYVNEQPTAGSIWYLIFASSVCMVAFGMLGFCFCFFHSRIQGTKMFSWFPCDNLFQRPHIFWHRDLLISFSPSAVPATFIQASFDLIFKVVVTWKSPHMLSVLDL